MSISCYLFSGEQLWGPLEATFSSWILSSGLHCTCELRASNKKHRDCSFHHLQTLFLGDYIVRQLDLRFLSVVCLIRFEITVTSSKKKDWNYVYSQNHKINDFFMEKIQLDALRKKHSNSKKTDLHLPENIYLLNII